MKLRQISSKTPKMPKIKDNHDSNCSAEHGEAIIKKNQNFTQIDLQRDSHKLFWGI